MPEEQPVPAASPAPAAKPSDDNLMAAVSYISLLAVVILLVKKDSEYVKFHAKQGLVLFIAEVIWVIIACLWGSTGVFLWFLSFISRVVWLLFIIVSIVGFIKAYSGERYRMTVVADIADKIKI